MKFYPSLIFCFLFFTGFLFSQEPADTAYNKEGKASFYARSFQGRKTASGDSFDNYDYTAAHRSLPFNTYLNVVNKKNNFNVIVRVNDRGPYVKNRIVDLTEAAARRIGGYHSGIIPVKIQVLDIIKPGPFIDSIFTAAPIVDCMGKIAEPDGYLISVWSTNDLVHAVYVANNLYLKEDVEMVYVANNLKAGKNKYHVIVGNIDTKNAAIRLKDHFEHKGFMKVIIIDEP